jgi:hypothetical protein
MDCLQHLFIAYLFHFIQFGGYEVVAHLCSLFAFSLQIMLLIFFSLDIEHFLTSLNKYLLKFLPVFNWIIKHHFTDG